jgi:hypothetical protein
MKISCPNCGKVTTLPPELIARIVREHEGGQPKAVTQSSEADFFQAVGQHSPSNARPPAAQGRPKIRMHPVKIAMLAATLLWPIATIGIYWMSYDHAISTATVTDKGVIFLNYGAGPMTSYAELHSQSFMTGLTFATACWVFGMAFLGALWFAIRR